MTSVDLSQNELYFPTPAFIRRAAQDALDEGHTHYTTRPGLNPLREEIASWLLRAYGVNVRAMTGVVITSGEDAGVFASLRAFAGAGDEIILVEPALPRDLKAAATSRAKVRSVDMTDLHNEVTPQTKVILIRNPDASGRAMSEDTLRSISAQLADSPGTILVSIETGSTLLGDRCHHRPTGALKELADRTITVSGFAPAYGLAAWRVGWLAGDDRLVSPAMQLTHAINLCSPAVSQYAALAAMTQQQDHVELVRADLAQRRNAAMNVLENYELIVARADAGVHLFIDARGLAEPTASLPDRLERDTGVRLADGALSGMNGWLRLTLAQDPESLAASVAQVSAVIARGAK